MFTHTDSTGATAVVTRNGLSPKTKHMQLRYLWLQELYTTRKLKLRKVGTLDNLGDVLTKHVTPQVLTRLLGRLGLINVLDTNVSTIYVTSFEESDFEVTSSDLELTSFEVTSSEVTRCDLKHDVTRLLTFVFPQHFSLPLCKPQELEPLAMAQQVTVVVTEKVLASAGLPNCSKGKYHSNWSCPGLQARRSSLQELPLGLAVTKGLTACAYCEGTLHSGNYLTPLGTPPPDSQLFTAATAPTSATAPEASSSGTSTATTPTVLCQPGLVELLDLRTSCTLEKSFNAGLTVKGNYSDFLTAKNFEGGCLSSNYYFVALPANKWHSYKHFRGTGPNYYKEELEERGNETFALTAWSAARYYFFRLEQTTGLTEEDKTEPPLVIALKFDTKRFFDSWASDNFHYGKFNRWYQDFFLTAYAPGLELTATMMQSALELQTHFSFISYQDATATFFKFKQLLWDGTAPPPFWLPAAQGNFNFTTARASATLDSEDSEERTETQHTARATAASSSTSADTVTQALAQALLVLTKKN